MTFQLDIDNPNGSHATIHVDMVRSALPGQLFSWNWQEIGPSTLEDDCIDRVEEEILDTLGDADDMTEEVHLARQRYWVPKEKTTTGLISGIDRVIDQYFI